MARLPKFVIERLARISGRGDPSGRTASSAVRLTGPTGHPDVNLLAAFAEHRLTGKERLPLLNHLAQCATCREYVVLAFPVLEERTAAPEARTETPQRGVSIWLRWGGLAAAVATVFAAIMLIHSPHRKGAVATIAENKRVLATQAAPPSATAGSRTTEAPVKPAELRPGIDLAKKLPPPSSGLRNGTAPKTGVLSETVTLPAEKAPTNASVARPAPVPSVGALTFQSTNRAKEIEATGAAPGLGVPAPAARPAGAEAPSEMAKPVAAASPKKAKVHFSPQAAFVGKAREIPRMAPSTGGVEAAVAGLSSTPKSAPGTAGKLSAEWSISAFGRVERSRDGGTTWEELHVGDGIVFRAVAATGSEVWAGGVHGALYHSLDGGEHWVQVSLASDSEGLTEAIVSIQFPDPQHGRVSTDAGETWATEDGGMHWNRDQGSGVGDQ